MTRLPFLQTRSEGVLLAIRLQPRASKNTIGKVLDQELKVQVTAPPVDSAANEALLQLLADALDCPRRAIQIVRGQTSRHKQVLVRGLSLAQAAAKLAKTERPPG